MYDAIVVLGKILKENGELIDASKAMVERAVELYKQGKASKVVFCGRWYFKLDAQPITEAGAMAKYAKELGLPETAVVLEENSDSTVANFIFCKEILEKSNWKKIIVINFYPFDKRAMMTARKVLGPEYLIDLDLLDYQLPEPKHSEYVRQEAEKVKVMEEFYKQFKDGDDQAIYQAHLNYLRDHGFPSPQE